MAVFNKFNSFVEALAEGTHNLGSNTLKVMLTNSAPLSTNTIKANLTEIAGGNGYTAGGHVLTVTSSSQALGVYKLIVSDIVITASGGSIGAFRYAVIYNDTAASDELIGYFDYGSSLTLASGESFTIDFDATNGLIFLT